MPGAGEKEIYSKTYYSIGGGFIVDEEHFGKESASELAVPYPFKSAQEMLGYCKETGMSLSGMVMQNELALHSKKEIEDYFANIWQTMRACIDRGMNTEGVLPGPLRVPRRASALRRMLVASDKLSHDPMNVVDWVNMFALAVNEENAAGGRVVTAPTNGACGIVPAVLAYYDHFIEPVSPDIYIRYFLASGAIGTLYKMNASISGCGGGLSGRSGRGLLDGRCGPGGNPWSQPRAGLRGGGNRHGAQPWPHLRPGGRPGTGAVHRT